MEEQESRLTKKFIQKDLDEEQPCLLTFSAQGVWGLPKAMTSLKSIRLLLPRLRADMRGKRQRLETTTDVVL